MSFRSPWRRHRLLAGPCTLHQIVGDFPPTLRPINAQGECLGPLRRSDKRQLTWVWPTDDSSTFLSRLLEQGLLQGSSACGSLAQIDVVLALELIARSRQAGSKSSPPRC